jgi:hypothetical protein
MSVKATITVQNKKYEYSLAKTKESGVVHFVCVAANIDQDFLAEDIPALLLDLPHLIVAEIEHKEADTEVLRFRISAEDKKKIQQKAQSRGFKSVSDYLRAQALA